MCCTTRRPIPSPKGPRTLDHRYLTEDLPYGLVPLCAPGPEAGVETPCLEALIGMFGLYMDQDYFSRGRRWNSWTCPGTGKASGGRTDVRPPLQLVENPLPREASQSSVARRRRNSIKSVISEDMSLGNDTSWRVRRLFRMKSSPTRHAASSRKRHLCLFRESQRGPHGCAAPVGPFP